jgi:hypothetical protein
MIVAAILVSFVFWYFNQSDAETSAVGDCLYNKGTNSAPDLAKVDCSSADAEFKILGKFKDTSDDSKCDTVAKTEVSYIQSGSDDHNVVLCLGRLEVTTKGIVFHVKHDPLSPTSPTRGPIGSGWPTSP